MIRENQRSLQVLSDESQVTDESRHDTSDDSRSTNATLIARTSALEELPFFFEVGGRKLFGIFAKPRDQVVDTGFVICHPYGEEKQYSHRILTRFARRLAEHGISSLRFDCTGYGDSEGLLEDSTLRSQVQETLAAIARARDDFGVKKITLLGLRWGGSLAAHVAEECADLAALVLWSPIITGSSYVDQLLRRSQLAALATKARPLNKEESWRRLRSHGYIDVEGNKLTGGTAKEMASLNLVDVAKTYSGRVLLAGTTKTGTENSESTKLADAYRNSGAILEQINPETYEYWDNRSMYSGRLPECLYAETVRWAKLC